MKYALKLFILFACLSSCKISDLKISAPTAYTTNGSNVSFNHSQFLTASCIQCHENKRPQSTPPHGQGGDCLGCHSASPNSAGVVSWKNITNFNHSPMPTSCISCHESKRPTDLSPHLEKQWGQKEDCASCHTYPNWKQAKFDHVKPMTSCVECHRTVTKDDRPVPKASHPTDTYNQIDCIQCHSNSTNNKKWAETIFNHKTHLPVPANCMTCHEVIRPLGHQVAPKIPGMDKADCKSCHISTTNWKQVVAFDHESAKPTSCVGCHANNVPATQPAHPSIVGNYFKIDCIQCHTYDKTSSPRSWTKTTFNHSTHTPGPTSCLECHKNVNNSYPKTNTHLTGSRSNKDCATCHKFDGIKLWTNFSVFDHIAIDMTERCDSCHNSTSQTLKSKPANHVTTTLDCTSCHTTTAWKPATFKHSQTDTNCASCHNGTIATGKTVNHVSTTLQCSSCHTQTAWKPASYKHTATDTNCTSCHNGTIASARPSTHNLNLANHQCSTCHTQAAFKPHTYTTSYKHSATGGMPPKGTSYHKSQTSCTKCHSVTTDSVIYNDTLANSTLTPKCAGCHTSEYKANKHINKTITTNANCLSCHSYNGW